MQDNDIHEVINILQEASKQWPETTLALVADQTRSAPFRILIGTVLSLRTKDETPAEACKRLFFLADAPETMVSLSEETIDNAIYPVGFHTTKAKNILAICRILIDEYNSRVPDELDTLVAAACPHIAIGSMWKSIDRMRFISSDALTNMIV